MMGGVVVRQRAAARPGPVRPAGLLARAFETLVSWPRYLPPRVARLLPRVLVGFAVLGAFTFLVDLALLTALRSWTPVPLAADVALAYAAAFALNFVLNRRVNFRSHAPVGGQALRYALVICVDFGLTEGVTTGLAAAGLDFRLARLTAGACVAVFTYTASRRWVFPGAGGVCGSVPGSR